MYFFKFFVSLTTGAWREPPQSSIMHKLGGMEEDQLYKALYVKVNTLNWAWKAIKSQQSYVQFTGLCRQMPSYGLNEWYLTVVIPRVPLSRACYNNQSQIQPQHESQWRDLSFPGMGSAGMPDIGGRMQSWRSRLLVQKQVWIQEYSQARHVIVLRQCSHTVNPVFRIKFCPTCITSILSGFTFNFFILIQPNTSSRPWLSLSNASLRFDGSYSCVSSTYDN